MPQPGGPHHAPDPAHAPGTVPAVAPGDLSALPALRREVRAARRALSGSDQATAAAAARDRLAACWTPARGDVVTAYMADDGELDPGPVLVWLIAAGVTIALPCIGADDRITFRVHPPGTALAPGRFGLLEPSGAVVRVEDADVVLVPLVLFDATGGRAGRGKGYYDTALAGVTRTAPGLRPVTVGLAHDLQEIPVVPRATHDVPLDVIVTPTRLLPPGARIGARRDRPHGGDGTG